MYALPLIYLQRAKDSSVYHPLNFARDYANASPFPLISLYGHVGADGHVKTLLEEQLVVKNETILDRVD